MNKKTLKKTFGRLGSRTVLSGGAAVAATLIVGTLVRRNLRYRAAEHLAEPTILEHPNQPGLSELNPA